MSDTATVTITMTEDGQTIGATRTIRMGSDVPAVKAAAYALADTLIRIWPDSPSCRTAVIGEALAELARSEEEGQ